MKRQPRRLRIACSSRREHDRCDAGNARDLQQSRQGAERRLRPEDGLSLGRLGGHDGQCEIPRGDPRAAADRVPAGRVSVK